MSKNTCSRLVDPKCQPVYRLDSFAEQTAPGQVVDVEPDLHRDDLLRLMFGRSELPTILFVEPPSTSSSVERTRGF